MNKTLRVAAVQPPVPHGREGRARSVERGLELANEAAGAGAKIICLPEYFGLFGAPGQEWPDLVRPRDPLLKRCSDLARRRKVTILYPSLERSKGRLYNTTWILSATGRVVGRYRKVHLTLSEREENGISPGDGSPVFSANGLRFGIMTCYDAYFPEAARILAVGGAQAIFWPSLQRAATRETISLQTLSRAYDNCLYVVRASYGHPKDTVWTPGMMAGMSCIVDWDGRVVADLGHREGYVAADVPLGEPPPRPRSFGAAPESPRRFLFEDRRPRLYKPLCRKPR